jgi:MFS family permease
VSAGFALTAATLGGVAGRIGWGYVADRFLQPRRVLMVIGWLSAAFAVTMAFATPEWPPRLILPLALLFGGTAIGWNGVQLSEVARLAEPGMAGKVTGATSFVTFAGVVVGPPSLPLLSTQTRSNPTGFATFAAFSAGAAHALLRRREPRR